MSQNILEVKDLHVSVSEKEILKGVDLTVGSGETHVLMGPNGAGKSTLAGTLMGNPVYQVTGGAISFDGTDITQAAPAERARAGMFCSFQNPPEVPGLTLNEFIKNAIRAKTGKPIKIFKYAGQLRETMAILSMDESYAERELNVGFSGGEKKKAEILQMLMLAPKLAILDETDSGLDVDAVRTVSEGVRAYQNQSGGSLLIITHSTRILESLHVDYTHILVDGQIVKTGGPELVDVINERGFEDFEA